MKINDVIRKELIEDWVKLNSSLSDDVLERTAFKALYKRTWLYLSGMVRKDHIVLEDICLMNKLYQFSCRIIGEEVVDIADKCGLWGEYYTYCDIVEQLLDNIPKKRFAEGYLELAFYEKKFYLYTDGLDDVFDELFSLRGVWKWQ